MIKITLNYHRRINSIMYICDILGTYYNCDQVIYGTRTSNFCSNSFYQNKQINVNTMVVDGHKIKMDTLFVEFVGKGCDVEPFLWSNFAQDVTRSQKDIQVVRFAENLNTQFILTKRHKVYGTGNSFSQLVVKTVCCNTK